MRYINLPEVSGGSVTHQILKSYNSQSRLCLMQIWYKYFRDFFFKKIVAVRVIQEKDVNPYDFLHLLFLLS